MFDPNKHRKTAARLAELKTKIPQQWEIRKPKAGDFIQIYGDNIEELDVVTMFEQRNGAGKVQEWLIQGKDEKEEDQIAEEDIPKFIEKKIKSA